MSFCPGFFCGLRPLWALSGVASCVSRVDACVLRLLLMCGDRPRACLLSGGLVPLFWTGFRRCVHRRLIWATTMWSQAQATARPSPCFALERAECAAHTLAKRLQDRVPAGPGIAKDRTGVPSHRPPVGQYMVRNFHADYRPRT